MEENSGQDQQAQTYIKISPDHTYAFLIGAEVALPGMHPIPSVRDLEEINGPSHDVKRFALWLKHNHVPPKNIKVFISPLEKNKYIRKMLKDEDIIVEEANHNIICDALINPKKGWGGDSSPNLLYFYWGAHGCVSEGERLLFFGDTANSNQLNLSVKSLLWDLKTYGLYNLDYQIFIFDVCGDKLNRRINEDRLSIYDRQRDTDKTSKQFVLFASSMGQSAANPGELQGSLFFNKVMLRFSKWPQGEWPDINIVADEVVKEFKRKTKFKNSDTADRRKRMGKRGIQSCVGTQSSIFYYYSGPSGNCGAIFHRTRR